MSVRAPLAKRCALPAARANQMTRHHVPTSRAARGNGRSCAAVQLTLHDAAHRAAITGFPTSRSAALSLQRARSHVSSSSRVAEQSMRTGCSTFLARCPLRNELGAEAPRIRKESAQSAVRSSADLTASGLFERESASSPSCDTTLARWRLRWRDSRDDAPTDCGLWRVSSLRLRWSCLCVWACAVLPRQTPQTVWREGRVTPLHQFPALRSARRCRSAP